MKKYWERIHEIYSKKDWIKNTTIFAKFAAVHFPKKGKILDLGAGQGQDSRFFSNLGYDVVSTDISDFALKLSAENAKKKNMNIKFKQLDISDKLPFEDNRFDIVYSHLALHYYNDEKTKEIFQEIRRVLKPGGILASLFNTAEDPETNDSAYEFVEKDYYKSPDGLMKKYFSVHYLKKMTADLFDPIILDDKGETFKDEIKTLIRFIGKANTQG
jgi:SAM-dependent methyltransferase